MANIKIILLFFFLLFFKSFSQSKNTYEFVGGLKLNGSDEQVVSYKITFNEEKGVIKGFSITDLGGEHETKNTIVGTYDKNKNLLFFKEDEIVYTKSSVKKSSFCYVNFNGKMNLKSSNPKIDNKFVGLYKNETKCISGIIQMVGTKKIIKLATKINTKIQKSKKIDSKIKESVNPLKKLDSLNMNILKETENLQMFTKDKMIKFEISDPGVEDGDRITIYVNGKIILENYEVSKIKKIIEIPIVSKNTIIEVEAVNEGTMPPNTASVIIRDTNNELKTVTRLTKGKKTTISIESE
jgi:CheY-specific phosphatase CheX